MLPSTQPWPQGWEGQVGSPWGQSGSPAGCCSCPGLPATCLLSVGSCHWSLGQQGRRALGTVSRSSQGAFLEGTTSFSPVSGTHVRAGKPARSEPIRCLGSHPSAGQNPGAGSGWKEVGRGFLSELNLTPEANEEAEKHGSKETLELDLSSLGAIYLNFAIVFTSLWV